MKSLKTIAVLLVIILVFSGAMFGLNFITGPVIEANNAGAVFAPLLAVMPEGAVFGGDAQVTDLQDVPASVVAVYREANGLGYAISCTAESQYSTAPMKITLGISAECVTARAEEAVADRRESYDFATSRAVARLNILLELTAPYVKVGGAVLAMKGAAGREELDECKNAIRQLGLKLEKVHEFPMDGTNHMVIVLRKVAPTPAKFPRRYAKIKAAPL